MGSFIPTKNNKKKKAFQLTKCLFFFFFWGPLLFSSFITFYFLFILNDLKCYRNNTWSSANHFWTLIATERHIQGMFGMFFGLFIWVLDFLYFGDCNFFISNLFLTIASILDVWREHVQLLLDTKNNGALPLGFGLLWMLKCLIII
jgi:hypothetical protein